MAANKKPVQAELKLSEPEYAPKELDLSSMSIIDRMYCVADVVRNITKDMTVGNGNYEYKAVGDQQVTLTVKAAELKYGIISVPIKQELVSQETLHSAPDKDGNIKHTFVDTIKMTTRFMCKSPKPSVVGLESDQAGVTFLDVESYGRGVDNSDKGLGKASTYARKYGLLNAYKIATGEDPDAGKGITPESSNQMSPEQIMQSEVFNYLYKDKKYLASVCTHFGATGMDELESDAIKQIHKNLKNKGFI